MFSLFLQAMDAGTSSRPSTPAPVLPFAGRPANTEVITLLFFHFILLIEVVMEEFPITCII